ncbi:MAG: flagellar motor switch protein FliM [Solirubrobacteraceae bacterium]
MSDLLNPDQIAALFEAAKQGAVPETPAATARRGHRLRTVDFSRPTKFTNDHQRRISRAIDTFNATVATRLSAELRAQIELETINTTQLTWSAAQSQLPAGSVAVTLEVQPIGTRMMLTAEQPLVLSAIECLLGGIADRPPKERRFSDIDWTLTRRFIDTIVNQLSLVWQDLGGLSLVIEDMDLHQESSQVAVVSEPTYVVMIECRMNKQSSALALMIPWAAIETVSDRIAGREAPNDPEILRSSGIGRALARAPITLRAEVAAREVPIEQILALVPGSIIPLAAPAHAGVALFAENIKLGRAHPGCNGARRAVQIRGAEGA